MIIKPSSIKNQKLEEKYEKIEILEKEKDNDSQERR